MSEDVQKLILKSLPADGSTKSNINILSELQDVLPDLTEEEYQLARDVLIKKGFLGKGRGRGGSIYLLQSPSVGQEAIGETQGIFNELEQGETDTAVTPVNRSKKKKTTKKKSKKKAKQSGQPKEVIAYRHKDTRVNNPEVGMVHADSDPDGSKTRWDYDPHLDPRLNFDSKRASIEELIDDAIPSQESEESADKVLTELADKLLSIEELDQEAVLDIFRKAIDTDRQINGRDRMRTALKELKRLQAPYLEWTGKAERTSFDIDTVSLHVHERVDPATILANATKRLQSDNPMQQMRQANLFDAAFENLPLRQALDFYKHEKGWSNRLVAGDSLLVMNSLLTKEGMGGKVQMIYIDPPYGIKYGSNFQPFTGNRDVKDRADADLTQEPEMIKAFRDTWELGIHSYLTYLRDRMVISRDLLSESGSIFIQISDQNLHLAKNLLDEVFGSENFISCINYQTMTPLESGRLETVFDYLLWYGKNAKESKYRNLYRDKKYDGNPEFKFFNLAPGYRELTKLEKEEGLDELPEDVIFKRSVLESSGFTKSCMFEMVFEGEPFTPRGGKSWRTNRLGMDRLTRANRLFVLGSKLYSKLYYHDFPKMSWLNTWSDTVAGFGEVKTYAVQTHPKVVERCLLMTTDPGDLVLDPTCGSGTTAVAAEKWGRRWVTCDTSRVAVTLAKQRLMTSSFDYFSLRYPQEGLKGGFDYETVPHITLKSIANNPDIDSIYTEEHPKIAAALDELNEGLSVNPPDAFKPSQGVRKGRDVSFTSGGILDEWEVPYDWPEDWAPTVHSAFDTFHSARKAMQRRMDQSIADHANQETLYDKPRIDKTRLRITGPFSVEAVPAPTVLALDENHPSFEPDDSIARSGETSRQAMWRDELLKTGAQGKGGARLMLAELEILPTLRYIHASGSVRESGERVVVSFGPEHAALEQRQVELALNEIETLRPAPKFVLFCAFTFDPEAAKDIDEVEWPGVTLLKVQMNTDLLTEDLKKKRVSSQSFWLMGQPDVDLRQRDDGLWEVEVHGFDYFDPRKGEINSGGKKQIAMWLLDTDYDQRSLMPQQVFFPMADAKGGWNRLKKTIRAELDENLLEQFHGTVSLPFEAGENRRVAIKIVDDRGIESLKILDLAS